MGIVYKAHDIELDDVALKMLRPDLSTPNSSIGSRARSSWPGASPTRMCCARLISAKLMDARTSRWNMFAA
jgi:hypothetical protein